MNYFVPRISFLVVIILCTSNSVWADTSATLPNNDEPAAVQASSPLSGGVVSSASSAEASLKELGKVWHHLKSAAWDTFCETQQPVTFYVGGPNLVGAMVIPAINGTGSISTGDFLPPREKWLRYYASQLNYLLPLIKSESEALQLPPDFDPDVVVQLAQLKVIAASLPSDVDKLVSLCQNPPYKNMVVATAAQQLINDLDAYEKLRKEIDKAVKDDVQKLKRGQNKKSK
ncbi:hypothetical protein KBI23_17310 [bacterium]|nr:hypothetical protein [bacterium]MBP9807624.1 hypothetical protein [bacterium]